MRRRNRIVIIIATVAVLIVLVILESGPSNPKYRGKRVSEWFEGAYSGDSDNNVRAGEMLLDMEGDAIPFLASQLNRPNTFESFYTKIHSAFPPRITDKFPEPHDDSYWKPRRFFAVGILTEVVRTQRLKAELGEPSTKPGITVALPALIQAVNSPDPTVQFHSAFALLESGPAALPVLPDLMRRAQSPNTNHRRVAALALGGPGPLASNAVPNLMQIARETNEEPDIRSYAINSLGAIGEPARPAVSLLVSLLKNDNASIQRSAVRALARLGETPEDALPGLIRIRAGTDKMDAAWAAVALWNHDRQNGQLRNDVASFLKITKDSHISAQFIILDIAQAGATAAPFIPEIEALTNHADTNIQVLAKIALRKIRPPPQ